MLDIPYPNAKAVNKVYENEKRTSKKIVRARFNIGRVDSDVEADEKCCEGNVLPKIKSLIKKLRCPRNKSTEENTAEEVNKESTRLCRV